MFRFNVVIRWQNGDLEGFSGSSWTKHGAEEKALRQVIKKAAENDLGWKRLHKKEYAALSPEEKAEVQKDWQISESLSRKLTRKLESLNQTPSVEEAFDMDKLQQYFSIEVQGTHCVIARAEGCQYQIWSDSSGVTIQRLRDGTFPKTMKARSELLLSCLTDLGRKHYVSLHKRRTIQSRIYNRGVDKPIE